MDIYHYETRLKIINALFNTLQITALKKLIHRKHLLNTHLGNKDSERCYFTNFLCFAMTF